MSKTFLLLLNFAIYLQVYLLKSALGIVIPPRIKIPLKNEETEDWTLMKVSGGRVRGRMVTTNFTSDAYVYLGIPYAEPPIGELRYGAPEPRKPWPGIIDVRVAIVKCYLLKKLH